MDTRKQIEEILLNDYGCFDDFTVDKLLDLFAVSGSLCDYCKDDRTAVCCQTCLDEMINHTANTQ